jgi:hypothetical protein
MFEKRAGEKIIVNAKQNSSFSISVQNMQAIPVQS